MFIKKYLKHFKDIFNKHFLKKIDYMEEDIKK